MTKRGLRGRYASPEVPRGTLGSTRRGGRRGEMRNNIHIEADILHADYAERARRTTPSLANLLFNIFLEVLRSLSYSGRCLQKVTNEHTQTMAVKTRTRNAPGSLSVQRSLLFLSSFRTRNLRDMSATARVVDSGTLLTKHILRFICGLLAFLDR